MSNILQSSIFALLYGGDKIYIISKLAIMIRGLVIKSTGKWYKVMDESDTVYECRIRGKFRLKGFPLTNPVAVGDYVHFTSDEESGIGWIKEIEPRKNYVARQSPRKKHQLHLLASNIDQALLLITLVSPKLKQGFIDRFLLMTEPHNIPVTLIFNKSDLYSEEDMALLEYLRGVYEAIGYSVLLCSALDMTGIKAVRERIQSKTTLISGQSGVGKSTLLNALDTSLDIRTDDLSGRTGKGQHTTTFAEMHRLSSGTNVIDTPGIKTLSFNNLEPMDIAHNFREMFQASKQCKFGDCLHRTEPKCAVREQIETGEISELRYMNYVTLLQESEDQNYWERKTDY